jgi:hypothetical protein
MPGLGAADALQRETPGQAQVPKPNPESSRIECQ